MLEWEEQTLPFLPGSPENVSLWDWGLEEHQGWKRSSQAWPPCLLSSEEGKAW